MQQHAPSEQSTLDSLQKEQGAPAASGSSSLLQRQEDAAVADSPRQKAQQQTQERLQSSPRQTAQRRRLETLQQASPQAGAGKASSAGGLPDNLKNGVESLSGISMDAVRVHYNSAKPAQLNAHAYAQGLDIHLGPGQEKHLPHEAWHVVQQKQGRVKPTLQMKDKININDNEGLEKEADRMGGLALQLNAMSGSKSLSQTHPGVGQVRQFVFRDMEDELADDGDSVQPQNVATQSAKEKVYSMAFDKIKPMLVDLADLEENETKVVRLNVGGPRYRVIIQRAPFRGKGSGAKFFTMELNRQLSKGKYKYFGKIVVKKMKQPESVGMRQFDDLAKKKQNDEIGTLDAMSSHRHAPTFHGAVLHGDTYFVGMELAAGDLLSRVEGGANKASVSTWLRQTLQVLSHMHANLRAHGDVKADNVMISQTGDALLGDFGETTNLDPDDGTVSDERRYTAQKDDIKRYIQMVYKNLFGRNESAGALLNHLNEIEPKTALDNFCRAAFAGSSNADDEPPTVTMQTLAGQLNDAAVWPR